MTKGYTVQNPTAFRFNISYNQQVSMFSMRLLKVYPKRSFIVDDYRVCVPAIMELAKECNVEIRYKAVLDYRERGNQYYEAVGDRDDVMIFALRWNSDWGTRLDKSDL